MVQTKSLLSRTTAIATAAALVGVALIPTLLGHVSAGLPVNRKITMSTSAASATDVTYALSFTTNNGATSNMYGLVLEFCDNSPILADSCTAPVGFDVNEAGLAVSVGGTGMAAFAVDASTIANRLVLTSATNNNIANATAVTVTLGGAGGSDGITNPSTGNHTFYARLTTYALAAGATGSTTTSLGSYLDGGGVALSTANQINITSKVQERLSFCVYDRANCAAGTSGIALGNFQGVLDTSGPFVDKQAKFDIATNALGGAVVVMKGDTLKSGAFDIAPLLTAAPTSAGTEQFGMCLWQLSGTGLDITTGTVGNSNYNSGACSSTTQTAGPSGTGTNTVGGDGGASFGFNTTNTTSANGETIAVKPAGSTSTANLAFLGNIAYTTEAGIYTTTLTYIATGTY